MKVKIQAKGNADIQNKIKEYPSLKEYFNSVANELGCGVKDIVVLSVHPDKEENDPEGYVHQSFFPNDTEVKEIEVTDNYQTEGGQVVGTVVKLEADGIIFMAECHASPYTVYGNSKKVEKL